MRLVDTLLLSDGYPASLAKGWLVNAVTIDAANSIVGARSHVGTALSVSCDR